MDLSKLKFHRANGESLYDQLVNALESAIEEGGLAPGARLPSERVAELSGVTGVATPFIVAFEQFFTDCDAAERFVNRSPRLKRLEADRQALLDAIRRAQLLLSVKRLPNSGESGSHAPSLAQKRTRRQRHPCC